MQTAFSDAVSAARRELTTEIAVSPEQVFAAQKLRYRVYCEERGFEPSNNDALEQDEFDPAARHVLVRNRATGTVLGTVRIVLSTKEKGLNGLPMQRVCEQGVLAPLPVGYVGEISRFALTRDREGISPSASALMRLCLIRGLIQISADNELTHWCAIMERSLLRLLRATAIHFMPVGPTVEYHGIRQPAVCEIDGMLNRMNLDHRLVWQYLTDNGALWSNRLIAQRELLFA